MNSSTSSRACQLLLRLDWRPRHTGTCAPHWWAGTGTPPCSSLRCSIAPSRLASTTTSQQQLGRQPSLYQSLMTEKKNAVQCHTHLGRLVLVLLPSSSFRRRVASNSLALITESNQTAVQCHTHLGRLVLVLLPCSSFRRRVASSSLASTTHNNSSSQDKHLLVTSDWPIAGEHHVTNNNAIHTLVGWY